MGNLHLKDNPTLQDLQAYVAQAVKERGFKDHKVEQRFLLLLEESGEFAKAVRTHAGLGFAKDTETKEMAGEAADVFIILLGICNMLGIDLEQAFRDKERKNKQRVWK